MLFSKLKLDFDKNRKLKRLFILLIVAAFISIISQKFDIGDVRNFVEDTGVFAPITFIFLKIAFIVLAPMTGFPMFLFAGPLFGFMKGWVYLMIADIIGTSLAFFLSREYGRNLYFKFISKGKNHFLTKLLSSVKTWRGVVITRFIFPFQDIITYAAGLTSISFKSFIISSTIVKGISFLVLISLGMALLDKKTSIFIFGIAFIVVVGGLIIKKLRKSDSKQ
ncbi:MAG: TVP38/TMEM64 family protein [Nanoarchaeota archaeon]|nr:TVP38/TMEM64 family protein [Nanoarchaeota archaeon]